MDFETLRQAIQNKQNPPDTLSKPLAALWHDALGNWHQAHTLCQEAENREGDRVHAYLHRKEGNETNASYWYHKIGEQKPTCTLEEEWTHLTQRLLD